MNFEKITVRLHVFINQIFKFQVFVVYNYAKKEFINRIINNIQFEKKFIYMLRIERTCNLIIKISNSRLINNNKKKL